MRYYTSYMGYMSRFSTLMLVCAWVSVSVFFVTDSIRAADTIAPEISNVVVTDLTETSAKVTWTTDEGGDSVVNYGLKEDYGIVRDPVADKKEHVITLEGLEPGRKYHFRVVSSDAEGNQGISADYQLVTKGTPQSSSAGAGENESQSQTESQSQSESQTESTEKIVEQIKQITSPEKLQEILNETVKAIQGITEELTIVGPPTVIPETTTAKVMWTTDRDASSEVLFSPADSFVEGAPYAFSQQGTGAPTKDHQIELIGLQPYTEYHFKVKSTDSYNLSGESRDFTFRTKASLPQIKNLRIVKVEENAATLAWDTTIPAKALIEYQDLTTGAQNSKGRPTLASTHQMRLSDLTLGSRYLAFVIAENAGGDRVKSNPITFVTVRDKEPPIISNVTNESTLFPGSEARIQTIIAWDTDEPSLCTLQYREGIAPGVDPITLKTEDQSFTERHVEVIVDFAPGTVYKFWLNCADDAENSIKSEDFVLFTPTKEKNIIDIIIENFQGAFGWIKNIGGK